MTYNELMETIRGMKRDRDRIEWLEKQWESVAKIDITTVPGPAEHPLPLVVITCSGRTVEARSVREAIDKARGVSNANPS